VPLAAGQIAPDFTLLDQTGTETNLRHLLDSGPVVLFFYPAAMTKGCTAESCHFRDLKAEFEALGAQRVGISADGVDKQQQFAAKNDFDYPLLSDLGSKVAASYGVKRSFGPIPVKRTTFVIGTDGRIIEAIRSEIRMSAHADGALRALRRLGSPPGSNVPPSARA
jgi:peroxiredoxin Q/BCP